MTKKKAPSAKQIHEILTKFDALEGAVRDLIQVNLRSMHECEALQKALQTFMEGHGSKQQNVVDTGKKSQSPAKAKLSNRTDSGTYINFEDEINNRPDLLLLLRQDVSVLKLSTRADNLLQNHGIYTIGCLIQCTERELLRTRGFGRISLQEIVTKLNQIQLELGMDIGSYAKDFPKQ
jgi:DNA-directed RNA polymerase alpha subunit